MRSSREGHTDNSVDHPRHHHRDTGMGSGCPGRCLGPCPPHSPAAWHNPRQLRVPRARFSSTGGIHGSGGGLCPGPARSGVCGWGPHPGNSLQALQGTRGKHNSDAAELQLLLLGSPRVPAHSVSAEWSLSSLSPTAPGSACPWRELGKEQQRRAQLRQPDRDHISHSARPGPPGCAQHDVGWHLGGLCYPRSLFPRQQQ